MKSPELSRAVSALSLAPSDEHGMTLFSREQRVRQEPEILIADRNPHVRKFLKRELAAEGYPVRVAENSRQVIEWVYRRESDVLLILDPDLPDANETALLRKLKNRIPFLQVIIHAFPSGYDPDEFDAGIFVEKGGSSIERLKQVVSELLRQHSGPHTDNGDH